LISITNFIYYKSKSRYEKFMKITVSVIKADVGGIGGHTLPSNGLLDAIRKTV